MITAADFQAGTVTQTCDNCGHELCVDIQLLELEVMGGGVVAFPACKCGAREVVFRTFAKSFERSPPSVRHLAANLLAARLKSMGKVSPAASARAKDETELPYGVAELGDLESFLAVDLLNLLSKKTSD